MRQLSFNVSIVNGNIPEDDKTFGTSLTLDPADQTRLGNHVTVSPDVATATIQDDEGKKYLLNRYIHIILAETCFFNLFTKEIAVGYVHTTVTVLESDRVAQLTVAISMPPEADSIQTSFFLAMTTLDQSATGLSWRLGFVFCTTTPLLY